MSVKTAPPEFLPGPHRRRKSGFRRLAVPWCCGAAAFRVQRILVFCKVLL